MLILGISTSTKQVGAAVGGHEGVLASSHSARGKRHAENLAPAIDFVCRQARIELDEVSAVAVDVGPGLFTGLRVGVAAAKAVAHALRVPMIGISSLDLLAWPLRHTSREIVAVVDARRGEVFAARYRPTPGGVQRLAEPMVCGPEDLRAELQAHDHDYLVVGDGGLRYADLLDDIVSVEIAEQHLAYPNASSLVQLAHARAIREDFVQPWQLEPLYLRPPDAEINWSTREGLAPGEAR
ncbi:MAG TPA: tRNA (adenosine(37)-N6)-threonylcarbamoyltransferase complex dimerization subunit type 1 TsaB [Acidimicrobiales bacterium]|nr:tRNA (adenosine(37)-N6)-threonylcarbamoyltransferase complex dimerization subunit type 1 TsaB [Acidimicrobiales bacterium]